VITCKAGGGGVGGTAGVAFPHHAHFLTISILLMFLKDCCASTLCHARVA
jgi:hypothetical protein